MMNKLLIIILLLFSLTFSRAYTSTNYYDNNTYSSATEIVFNNTDSIVKIQYIYVTEELYVYLKNKKVVKFNHIKRTQFKQFKKSIYPDNFYKQLLNSCGYGG